MENIDKAYQEALDYLYSFVDYSLTRSFRYSPEKFNLDRMRLLLKEMGNPHCDYPVIHIAGTKGKGSTAAFIASALRAYGKKTGFYTSPHLQEFSERIQVNGKIIPHHDVVKILDQMKPLVAQIPLLTTFELTTALAFMYFSEQKVDVAVVEVGLGGRLDATNVVDPMVSVITSLSMDHMNVLGDTLAKIAAEKGGIIKEGRPVILAPQKEEARKVVLEIALERHAPLVEVGNDYRYALNEHSLQGQSFYLWRSSEQQQADQFFENEDGSTWQPLKLNIPLLGYIQIENATTAYAALQTIRQQGFDISEADIKKGFAEVFWPGRFEVLSHTPILIIDSAHNPDSILKLRITLDDYLPEKPVIMVFGASEDKDIHGMFAEILPRIKRVIATQSIHPRAMEAEKLVELAHQFGTPAKAVVPLEAALDEAIKCTGESAAIVVCGSLFVAAAVREIWQNRQHDLKNFK